MREVPLSAAIALIIAGVCSFAGAMSVFFGLSFFGESQKQWFIAVGLLLFTAGMIVGGVAAFKETLQDMDREDAP